MKLKLFDRILLAILLIAALAVALVLFGVATRLISEPVALGFVSLFYYNTHNALILAGAGLIVLLIALRLLFAGRKKKGVQQSVTTLVRQGEIGSTFITLSAIDAMAKRHCAGIDRVQECFTSICTVDGGVSIGVRLSVQEDTDVVSLCEELQNSLKAHIETYTGIDVKEVGVLVENLNAAASIQAPAAVNSL